MKQHPVGNPLWGGNFTGCVLADTRRLLVVELAAKTPLHNRSPLL
jgi:hypothetical protein